MTGLWLLAAASLALASARVATPALPALPALAPVLAAALSAPPVLPPGLAQPAASFELARARVLLERASPLSAASPSAEPGALATASPARTLETVNAVLKDFSPERLAELPAEDVEALGGLVFDALSGAASRADARSVGVLAQARAERISPLLGKPVAERALFEPGDDRHEAEIEVRGLPEGARWLRSDGRTVYRHYTTEEGAASIRESGSLWNGFVSYVQRSPGLWRKTFVDATGVFLTRRGIGGGEVGVPAREYPVYVDLLLPPGLPILELEGGKILMIPLAARTRGWVADLYRRWATRGESPGIYRAGVEELDRSGGLGPELAVPVTPLRLGRSR